MTRSNFSLFSLMLATMFLVSCSRDQHLQGYIEGRYTYMASNESGVLKEIMVDRGSEVKVGDPLFVLDKQPESDEYNEAQKNLESANAARDAIQANLVYAELTYKRNKILVPKNALQQSELDKSKSNYDATIAQLAEAESNVAAAAAAFSKAKWSLEQKSIVAPVDAVVFQRFYRLGERVETGQPVVSLLAPADVKAVFYVREPQLAGIHVNDEIFIQCDSCKEAKSGKVSFISPTAEYTPPVIFSNETNEKLLYRVEATFSPEIARILHPGQPVRVSYHPHG